MNKYIVAFDGGGTKTDIALIDINGNVLYFETGPGCNHASHDGRHFQNTLQTLYLNALLNTNLKKEDISFIYLGLSGADLESDFIKLNKGCKEIFKDTPFKVVNDAWIIMRSGLKQPYGAVAICGTGTNSAAINKNKERAILRSLSYVLGTYGGGLDIAREALHQAFGYEEGTYQYTMLYDEIPKIYGVNDLKEVVDFFYPINKTTKKELGAITALVNELALKGDKASIFALSKAGTAVGMQTAGVIERVKIQDEAINVVVGGRVFSSKSDAFINAFKEALYKRVPKAKIVKPMFKPVIGAYFSALDELNINQTDEIEKNILESCEKNVKES
ncbi:hypothetical protein LJC17_00505 [Acholeplasma sp. OttesenSCG-928-E16]|nr:hypothetical protein [Acholeplasma sp. OttesenSCG-928-E16]